MKDLKTHAYFNEFTPHYNPKRLTFAIDYLNKIATDDQKLLDIGCGDGATLFLIKENTPLKKLVGMDISKNYLKKANSLVGCDTIEGSILDNKSLEVHLGEYDYCILAAVIHHLIGKNRKESFSYAETCIKNAIKLLKPGGILIIFEPTFGPSLLMDLVFWIKKVVTNLTSKRVELSKKWANIGEPVVSYYTPEQLLSFITGTANIQIASKEIVDSRRLGFIIHRVGMGVIVKKSG